MKRIQRSVVIVLLLLGIATIAVVLLSAVGQNASTDQALAAQQPETITGADCSRVSVSTDGGVTFTRLNPSPFTNGHGTNYGDPIVVYNARLVKWFAGDLATGCGGQGIGLWTSLDGLTWRKGKCAHNGSSDDRESMWVDNNPTSPFYGRMYISWNDFAAGQLVFVT